MNANGKVNGTAQAQSVQVNPAEVARFALVFLARVDFKSNERQMFDLTEGMLRAIAEGQVTLSQAPTQGETAVQTPAPQTELADTVQ
jgi:hypothetical protein